MSCTYGPEYLFSCVSISLCGIFLKSATPCSQEKDFITYSRGQFTLIHKGSKNKTKQKPTTLEVDTELDCVTKSCFLVEMFLSPWGRTAKNWGLCMWPESGWQEIPDPYMASHGMWIQSWFILMFSLSLYFIKAFSLFFNSESFLGSLL